MAPGGELWVSTEVRGVARLNQKTSQVQWFGEKQGLLGKAAYALSFDRKQRLWVGTEAGLFIAPPPYVDDCRRKR
jgi:ligand-binding sensor domain-containing protein